MNDNREYAMKWIEARKRLARMRYDMIKRYGWLVFLSEVGEQ